MRERRSTQTILCAVGLTLLCFAGAFQRGLWTPDEPREAEIGREMLVSHFSAMPTLGGLPFLEKPPLYAWATAASYGVFGVSPGAARIPSALFSAGALFVAYLLGRRAAGRTAGLCSAVALATMWQFAETSHRAVLDDALTFFVAAGHLAFLSLWKKARGGAGAYAAIGVLSGLAFLTKGVIGPALMCAPPILAAAALRDWEYVKRVLPRAAAASILGVAAFGLPWVFALAHTPDGGWEAVKTCLWTNTIGRSIGGDAATYGFGGHAKPFWYYLFSAPVALLPWTLVLPAAFLGGMFARTWRGGRTAFCALVFAMGVLLLSVPSGKRELYLVPLMPIAAVVAGVWLSRAETRRGSRADATTLRVLRGFATIVFVAVVLAMGGLALGLPLPSSVPQATRDALAAESRAMAVYGVIVGVFVLGPYRWARTKLVPRDAPAPRLAAAFVLVMLVIHAAAYPMLDPLRDMKDGARRIAALVPADEELLAFSADETTQAIVPFFTDRNLRDVDKNTPEVVAEATRIVAAEPKRKIESALAQALTAETIRILDSGRAKHLIVMDEDVKNVAPKLAARLDLVETVRVSSSREVNVYAARP